MIPAPLAPGRGWSISRRDLGWAALLALLAAAFRLPGLGYPPEPYFDEVYHAKAAAQYLAGEAPTEWVHPPTAKLLIAVPVKIFGYKPWAWRLAPALAGTLLAPTFFLFARRLLATERAALLASILLLADGVYLVQSRIAMTNIFAVLFQVAAALVILDSVLCERLPVVKMIGAGLLLGLALSTRWTSLWATAFLGLVLLVVRGRRLFRGRELLLTAVAFVVLPVAIYILSYLPLQILRPGLAPWHDLSELYDLQVEVWRYHANLNATHPYFSKWWTWPWLYRPTWYFYETVGDKVRGIMAVGNPALWWVSVPVTLYSLLTGLKARDPRWLFVGAGFALLYLPWGISPRTLNYGHYLFEAIPYACLSLGMLLDRWWDGRAGPWARAYLAVVVLLFLFFLPFLTAMPVPSTWFFGQTFLKLRLWTWFPTWV
jgi:dolichyl-phosphate-mannose--protein O-mannosyl transferase